MEPNGNRPHGERALAKRAGGTGVLRWRRRPRRAAAERANSKAAVMVTGEARVTAGSFRFSWESGTLPP